MIAIIRIAGAAALLAALLSAPWAAAGAAQDHAAPPSLGQAPPAQRQDQDAALIRQVRIEGLEHVPQDEANSLLETKPAAALSLSQGPRVDRLALLRDRQRLVELCKEYGFFSAKITSHVETMLVGGAQVIFRVKEGPPTLIQSVTLDIEPAEAADQWRQPLRKAIGIDKGQRFELDAYRRSKQALSNTLSRRAHPQGQVLGQVRVRPRRHAAEVIFKVKPGPKLAFGQTTVAGQPWVEKSYIREYTTYTEGQAYDPAELQNTEQALLNTGFFAAVRLTPQLDKVSGGRVPMVINVTMRARHTVKAGVGWGTEDQARLRIQQINRNTLGLNDELSFDGKLSSIYQGLVGRLFIPHILDKNTSFVTRGGLEQLEEEAYVGRRYFATPVLRRGFGQYWRAEVGYNVESDELLNIRTDVPDKSYEEQDFFVSSVVAGLGFDNRDSPLNPTEGTYARLEVEAALEELGSELNFVRAVLDIRHIIPLHARDGWLLALRAKGGVIDALPGTGRIPLMHRFYPGGADSVRGYPYQRLGPLDSQGKPLGGEAMAIGSVELRFPIVGELGGVLFSDLGNAWEGINDQVGQLRYTVGCGLRYNTPVGPLRVDFGYQLNPPEDARIERYDFYLSVGQAF